MPLDHDQRTYASVTASSYEGNARGEYDASRREISIFLANGVHLALGLVAAEQLYDVLDAALAAGIAHAAGDPPAPDAANGSHGAAVR